MKDKNEETGNFEGTARKQYIRENVREAEGPGDNVKDMTEIISEEQESDMKPRTICVNDLKSKKVSFSLTDTMIVIYYIYDAPIQRKFPTQGKIKKYKRITTIEL